MCDKVVDEDSGDDLRYAVGLESNDSVARLGDFGLSGVGILWNSKAGGIEMTPSIKVGIRLSGGIVYST